MNTKDYEMIAAAIWRSGFIEDKNKIRQGAKEKMRRLIAGDLAACLKNQDKEFNQEQFLKSCGIYF